MAFTDNFTPGWGSKAVLRSYNGTTAGTGKAIPLLPGCQFGMNDNTRLEMLAQGNAASAWAVNFVPGVKTVALSLNCRPMAHWFTKTFLDEVFFTRDANGESNQVDIYWTDGSLKDIPGAPDAAFTGWGRVASLTIGGSARAAGAVNCQMNILAVPQALVGGALTPGTFTGSTGAPLYFRGVEFVTPTLLNDPLTPDLVEEFSLSMFMGVNYGKWFDGTANANTVDSGPQTGAFSITQRQTATVKLHKFQTCTVKMKFSFYPNGADDVAATSWLSMEFPLTRQGFSEGTTFGNASVTSMWSVFSDVYANNPFLLVNST